MIIKRPIYFIRIEGDVKQYVSSMPSTIIATYEEHLNKTYVIVAADENNNCKEVEKMYKKIHIDIEAQEKKHKEVYVEVKYSKEGINFKTEY